MPPTAEILILIVDDRKHNLFALEQTLKDVPAKIIKAMSGDEALALSLQHEFALALVDVQMPGMDGYELAELLLGNPSTSGLPIIFVSAAYGDEAHRFRGYETGAVDYLVKPVDPVILRGKVKVFLELARMRAELQASVHERTHALEAKADQLARRNSFRKLLGAVSKDLTQRSAVEGRAGVSATLGKVAQFVGASHACARLRQAEPLAPSANAGAMEWHAAVEGRRPGQLTHLMNLGSLPGIANGEGVALARIEAVPDALSADRDRLVEQGVRAALLLPMMEEGLVTGLVAFAWRREGVLRDDLPEQLALLPDMVLGTLRRADATAEKERLAHVEAESRAKSQFLAAMSHEIRTPMNAVLGYTQLLLREAGLSARQREYLETIDRSGEHLLTIINNVLDMSRIESGTDALDLTVADFGDVLTDMERMFRLRAAERSVAFRVERSPDLPRRIQFDAGKVRQVLINLLGNAMKFAQGGAVTLTATVVLVALGRCRLSICVEDTGIGIPHDQIGNIFEPFVQVAPDAARTGTGLGLAVSRRFARLMGGDVAVASTVGVGSSFRFDFEADFTDDQAVGAGEPLVVGLSSDSPRVRVLVVEDDVDSRLMLTRMLDAVGLEVRSESTAADGVAAFAREACDLVLCDLGLPDGSGVDVMARIRELPGGAAVPFVIVSASTLQQDREQALAAGVDGFVGKPVREASVFREIARLTPARFEVVGGGHEQVSSGATLLDRAAVAALPVERREALVAALEGGYTEQISREMDALDGAAPAVARELRRLADAFEYATLFEVLGVEERG